MRKNHNHERQPVPRLAQDANGERSEASETLDSLENFTLSQTVEPSEAQTVQQPLAETIAEIASRVAMEGDKNRLAVGAEVVNTFNYAIQYQGKRNLWTAEDYRAFVIALSAIDSIGSKTIADNIAAEKNK